MRNKLNDFLNNFNIQTGSSIDDDYLILVEDNKTYDIVEKLIETSKKLENKGYKLNEFMGYFSKLSDDAIDYSESWLYCDSCGNYAHYNYYGVNDQYYINDCEVICSNCIDKEDYINFLIGNKDHCNTMLSDDDIASLDYNILDYDFNVDMYGGLQCDKKGLEDLLEDIPFFYYLNRTHMFGTYFTICVHNDYIDDAKKLLTSSRFSSFIN